ncbi:MAG: inositol monophosphatase family protein [Acidobacteriota bacterium]
MKTLLFELADHVRAAVLSTPGTLKDRQVHGVSPGGDAQFDIDEVAEQATWEFLVDRKAPVALYSEDQSLRAVTDRPEVLLLVDPIDGTRPAAAGLEMACISIAAAPFDESATLGDVRWALLREIKSGASLYADRVVDGLEARGYAGPMPNLSAVRKLDRMFWSFELNGHPMALMQQAYGHLVDASANRGGVFVFNSASYSISRVITGQLDAYVDIGNRLLKDRPELLAEFERVGNGHVLHLFPYDIAAAVLVAEKAGVVITDAYGHSLDDMLLTRLDAANQQSCIAASTPELHAALLDEIAWPAPSAAGVEALLGA